MRSTCWLTVSQVSETLPLDHLVPAMPPAHHRNRVGPEQKSRPSCPAISWNHELNIKCLMFYVARFWSGVSYSKN